MERFNITQFRAFQKNGEYTQVLKDTEINQYEYADGYAEKITPAKGWFYDYKDFYQSGQLRSQGKMFICGDYKAGLWIECDKNGNIISQTDYDAKYRMKLEDIFKILEARKIPFFRENSINKINREIVSNQAIWYIKWQVVHDRIETLNIDDVTRSIIKQGFIKFASDH
jgi:hypothetical protein